jgi:hypothetical protein
MSSEQGAGLTASQPPNQAEENALALAAVGQDYVHDGGRQDLFVAAQLQQFARFNRRAVGDVEMV